MEWEIMNTFSPDIIKWIRLLQPVHRCRKHAFESILIYEKLMSRAHMKLLQDPHFVTNAIMEHNQLRNILSRLNTRVLTDHCRDLIQTTVITEFNKQTQTPLIIPIVDTSPSKTTTTNVISPDCIIQAKKNILSTFLSEKDLNIIHHCTVKIVQASLNLNKERVGMGFMGDNELGTDKHVFGILGPHRGRYYGEIVLIFKRELMLHPSSHFSIPAATLFQNGNVYKCLPWIKDFGRQDTRIRQFHESKLHCSISGYACAAATKLIAIVGKDNKTMNIDMNDMIKWWKEADSHMVFESYLPSQISLSYIDHVYMPQSVFDSLTSEAQHSALTIFRDKITITNKTEKSYEAYLFDEFTKRFDPNTNKLPTLQGFMLNLFASFFTEQILLPITITQSYNLFLHVEQDKKYDYSLNVIYIYWQTTSGDMMVTISKEPINSEHHPDQLQCLVCYVAEISSSISSSNYLDSCSYLNNAHPLRHDTLKCTNHFKARSNTFHRGCGANKYMIYCLKIEHHDGRVTLSHVGCDNPNKHGMIQAEFSKNELDLCQLDYVQVSAGSQDVLIQNMIIQCESIDDLSVFQ